MFQTDPFSLIILFVGLSLLPFVAMVSTCYLKIVVVMSLIRNALGIQSIPPNMVINALAMILTFYIIAPMASESWNIAKTELAQTRPAADVAHVARARHADPAHDVAAARTVQRVSRSPREEMHDRVSVRGELWRGVRRARGLDELR